MIELTPDEVEMVLSTRRAHAQHIVDEHQTYEIMRRHAIEDGLVEVEPGHWVKPGEPWTDEQGVFHKR